MHIKKNIWCLCFVIFFHNLIPAYVIERLFWQERGMNVQMVVWCELIYAGTIILLELPSGILADRVGRKNLIVFGSLLAATEFVLLQNSYTFWHFGFVVFLAGISNACTSGAWNALLYDSLLACGKEEQFEKILGRIQSLDFCAAMIAALCGGFLASSFGFLTNYRISAVSSIIALAASFLLREPPRSGLQSEVPRTALQILGSAWSFFRRHIDVCVLLTQSMMVAACVVYVDEFWQIYFGEISFPIALFGLIAACFTLARIPGSLIVALLLRRFNHGALLLISSLGASLGILLVAFSQNIFGIVGFLIVFFCSGLVEPICAGYLHRRADPLARATIDSVSSLIQRVLTGVIGLAFGYIAGVFSIFSAYLLLGAVLLAASAVFGFVRSTPFGTPTSG